MVTLVVAVIYGSANVAAAFVAATKATHAKRYSEAAQESIGPIADGETVMQIVNEIRDLNTYQQGRNHDMIDIALYNSLCLDIIARTLGVDLPSRKLPPSRLEDN